MESKTREIAALEHVNLTDDGLNAILSLSHGDMRRMLNTMQSANLAFDVVNETNVHLCLGQPLPKDIETIFAHLMNSTVQEAFDSILKMMVSKGLALVDILKDIVEKYVQQGIELPPEVRIYLLEKLAQIEYHLAGATSDRIQLGAMIGAFYVARAMMEKHHSERS